MQPARVPDIDREITLYRLYNGSGELLYIGQTQDFDNRMRSHSMNISWGSEIATWTTEIFPDRASALAAERLAILRENPIHNLEVRNPWKVREPTKRVDYYLVSQSLMVLLQAGEITYREAMEEMKRCGVSHYKAAHLLGLANTYIDSETGWTRHCYGWGITRILELNNVA